MRGGWGRKVGKGFIIIEEDYRSGGIEGGCNILVA